jgi:toxin FitB
VNGFLLDTNIPSELTKPRPDPRVIPRLELANENEVFISIVTLGGDSQGRALLDPGELDAKRQQLGKPLNTVDGLIAATAIEHEITVVTHNVEDFDSLEVSIVNPWA